MRTKWTTKGNRDIGSSCSCDRGLHRYLRNFGGGGLTPPGTPLFWMVTKIEPFQYSYLTRLDFCLWCWMKSEVYKIKLGSWDEFLVRILDAAACIKKVKINWDKKTRDLRKRVAKCTEVDGEDFRTSIMNCWQIGLLNMKLQLNLT